MSGKKEASRVNANPAGSNEQLGLPEQHYTIASIAEQWSLSYDTVRRLFLDEPGVLKIGERSRLLGGRRKVYKRRYSIMRVPHSVLVRVQQRLVNKRENGVVRLPDNDVSALHAS